jgi:hypothetical protein
MSTLNIQALMIVSALLVAAAIIARLIMNDQSWSRRPAKILLWVDEQRRKALPEPEEENEISPFGLYFGFVLFVYFVYFLVKMIGG